MNEWKRYPKGRYHAGPFWARMYGDSFTGTAFETPTAEGRYSWFVGDSQCVGTKTFRQGLAPSVDEAKLSADAAVLDRRRGRGAVTEGEVTTSTDRNRRRVDRLLASEAMARGLVQDLSAYHHELVAAGDTKTASRIALLLRRAALSGLTDYMRRTAEFRVRSRPRMVSLEEIQADADAVLAVADELEALANDPAADVDGFETIATTLRQMGAFPDSQLYFAVIESFELTAPE